MRLLIFTVFIGIASSASISLPSGGAKAHAYASAGTGSSYDSASVPCSLSGRAKASAYASAHASTSSSSSSTLSVPCVGDIKVPCVTTDFKVPCVGTTSTTTPCVSASAASVSASVPCAAQTTQQSSNPCVVSGDQVQTLTTANGRQVSSDDPDIEWNRISAEEAKEKMKKGNTFIRVWKEGETPPPMPTYQPCATLLKTIEPCAPPTNVVFRPATPCVPAPQTKVVRRPCFRRRAYACAGASYSGGVRSSATPCQTTGTKAPCFCTGCQKFQVNMPCGGAAASATANVGSIKLPCDVSGLIKTGATSGAFAAASASVNGQSTEVTN
ncbi:uncharacterized protein LOC143459763 [Clavelina lepadiformis]|uniref:uncharacterized protein LOC143459763 n=1 Tax=Clavelina lepadiformis TaxID=159417 RepID=UPI0040427CD7